MCIIPHGNELSNSLVYKWVRVLKHTPQKAAFAKHFSCIKRNSIIWKCNLYASLYYTQTVLTIATTLPGSEVIFNTLNNKFDEIAICINKNRDKQVTLKIQNIVLVVGNIIFGYNQKLLFLFYHILFTTDSIFY